MVSKISVVLLVAQNRENNRYNKKKKMTHFQKRKRGKGQIQKFSIFFFSSLRSCKIQYSFHDHFLFALSPFHIPLLLFCSYILPFPELSSWWTRRHALYDRDIKEKQMEKCSRRYNKTQRERGWKGNKVKKKGRTFYARNNRNTHAHTNIRTSK
ncbi:uncharacterized protein TEOVI_000447100 [Trypanosoma equiperdum]|uniref:Uncharacterized protein n=2 Tax=Trypanozoon TaxID=39700 RepID=Q38DJ9_TRYB2|nr:hypothetical protein, unlikely [Trypanosoma brucei brucei TREU927]EAN77121.1 hypothetical protein, unlikely [Trypanosoma brucei brucei TREU927]SCU72887.1 hypothetical protein, conserved [Trypanosoma equiperdum]